MDDLRGRLDRASRRVEPRPDAMDVLRARRRRHDLRQRVTAGAVALTVTAMLVGGGVALFNGRNPASQVATPLSEPMFLGLWPERTLAEAEQVQAAVDAGNFFQGWRTDGGVTAVQFMTEVMHWNSSNLHISSRWGQDEATFSFRRPVTLGPPPGPPWWEETVEEVTIRRLVQNGEGGIWSVVDVRAVPLQMPYRPGSAVDTNANLTGEIIGEDLGNTASGSPCSGGEVVVLTHYPTTAQASFFRSPDCGQAGDGYIALTVGDEAPIDPLAPPDPGIRQRYLPVLTMVPVRFVESPSSVEPSPQAASAPYFPTMKRGYATGNDAALTGALHEQDGCVVVGDGDRADVVIWPEGYALRTNDDGTFAVLDSDGRRFATSGERVFLGGYHAMTHYDTVAWVEQRTGEPMPENCKAGGFWMMSGGTGGEAEGSVFHVTCDGTGTAVDESFATSGSHGWVFEVNNTTDGSVKLAVEKGPNYLGPVGPGVTKLGYIDAPPGDLRIACSDSSGGYSEWVGLHTASVFGLYTSPDLQCGPGDQWMSTISDYVSTTQGETGDLLVLARKDLSGLKAADEVRFSGYEEEPDQPIVVLRDDKRIASITYAPAPQGPGWIPSEVQACESSGIR